MKNQGSVLVFGTFDGLDEGHIFFLTKARALGERLFVSLPSDALVQRLKGHGPRQTFQGRLRALQARPEVFRVLSSDATPGTYQILQNVKPDCIAVGFDQNTLELDLKAWMKQNKIRIPLHRIPCQVEEA